jgi:hypothetical protein
MTLADVGPGTKVSVVHEGIPAPAAESTRRHWTEFFDLLAAETFGRA